MSIQAQCGNAMSVATDGYLIDKGVCGNAFSLASGGYVIEIIPDGDGGFNIKIKDRPGLKGGGAPIAGSREEEEEILLVIRLFLEYDSEGLL